jgi:hypothetical protein
VTEWKPAWSTTVIPALGRLREKKQELEASLGYILQEPVSKNKRSGGFQFKASPGEIVHETLS